MISKKSGHVDSISVFLKGVKQSSRQSKQVPEVRQSRTSILEILDEAAGRLDIAALHEVLPELSLTELNRALEQLEEAQLLSVDASSDTVELSPTGRSIAKLKQTSAL